MHARRRAPFGRMLVVAGGGRVDEIVRQMDACQTRRVVVFLPPVEEDADAFVRHLSSVLKSREAVTMHGLAAS